MLEQVVARQCLCPRRLAAGERAREVGAGRFLANDEVTIERLIEGWSRQTRTAVIGRHVLAIQDTSEIHFRTKPNNRRGLGAVGKGNARGLLAHTMIAVDADTGACLGPLTGSIDNRKRRVRVAHAKRALKDKESKRWAETAEKAKPILAAAVCVTEVADRESDIFARWASVPEPGYHVLTRAWHDRAVAGGGKLSDRIDPWPWVATRTIELKATPKRAARRATLSLRFGEVEVCKPHGKDLGGLPEAVKLCVVEVHERDAPAGVEAVHWRLLTTHALADVAKAWQIVDWYRMRWLIEELFRLMKAQGLRLEDSQQESAEALMKLTAIAVRAACIILQLRQAREGCTAEPATNVVDARDLPVLDQLNASLAGRTDLQKNPHARHTLAWAAWIIAKLGGWNGYPSSRPPGPITFRNGWEYFQAIAKGWRLHPVCIP